MVSGRRTGRRRLRRAAHVLGERRKEFPARDAVVQHRELRGAPVAMDPGCARIADRIPGPRRSRDRLHPRDDRVPAAVAARPDGGGVRGRVHVDHRDAIELGRKLPGQRFLPALLEEERNRAALRQRVEVGDSVSDHRVGGDHVQAGLDRGRVEAAAGYRRRHRRRAAAALVLVAHQCVERSIGHDLGLRGLARAADGLGTRSATSRATSPGS